MNKKSFEIKSGIKLHLIETDFFKTNLVCVIITVPLREEIVTKNALIPFVLRRGTKELPSQAMLNEKLENLYGANFDCGIDKIGDNHVLKFYIESVDNDYAFDGENILKETVDLLLKIVFDPHKEDGIFNKDFVDVEKETLRKVIESKIDDKDAYAISQCVYNMYDKKGRGATIMLLGAVMLLVVHTLFAIPGINAPVFAVILILLLGVTFSLVPSAMWPSVPKIIPERQLGTAYALIFWVQNIGLMTVPLLIGWVLDTYTITNPDAVLMGVKPHYDYTIPMTIFAGLGLLAIFVALLLKAEDKKKGYGLELPNIQELKEVVIESTNRDI